MARYVAKNGWERCVQVARWLRSEFKLPEDMTLELVDNIDGPDVLGEVVERSGGRLVIKISNKMCRSVHQKIEVLIHEAAHVKLYDRGLGYLHGPVFWTTFGEMMDAFDHHGHEDSRAFPVN